MSDSSPRPSDMNNKRPRFPSPSAGVILETDLEMKKGAAMRRAVKQLHFGRWDEKAAAASDIKRMAKEDSGMRRVLAKLGVIPSLVAMYVESVEDDHRRLAVEALIELASGTYTNKVLMVEAGVLAKLPQLMCTQDMSRKQEFALLLLSISTLAKTPFPFSSHHILPFLVDIISSGEAVADEFKITCLACLYNLSTKLENIKDIVSSGAVHALLTLTLNIRASEGALSILANLVPTSLGKKAVEDDPLATKALIEILVWNEKPRCQELSAYLLMILAHGSRLRRQKMARLGAVPALLEVVLLGSPLAQRRALKILQWFKDEGTMKTGAHSGPQVERASSLSSCRLAGGEAKAKEDREGLKRIVRQSLDKNMEMMMGRGDASEGFSSLKALVVSSSSKSLPY